MQSTYIPFYLSAADINDSNTIANVIKLLIDEVSVFKFSVPKHSEDIISKIFKTGQ